MRLQRRLYGLNTVCFPIFVNHCNCKKNVHCKINEKAIIDYIQGRTLFITLISWYLKVSGSFTVSSFVGNPHFSMTINKKIWINTGPKIDLLLKKKQKQTIVYTKKKKHRSFSSKTSKNIFVIINFFAQKNLRNVFFYNKIMS